MAKPEAPAADTAADEDPLRAEAADELPEPARNPSRSVRRNWRPCLEATADMGRRGLMALSEQTAARLSASMSLAQMQISTLQVIGGRPSTVLSRRARGRCCDPRRASVRAEQGRATREVATDRFGVGALRPRRSRAWQGADDWRWSSLDGQVVLKPARQIRRGKRSSSRSRTIHVSVCYRRCAGHAR